MVGAAVAPPDETLPRPRPVEAVPNDDRPSLSVVVTEQRRRALKVWDTVGFALAVAAVITLAIWRGPRRAANAPPASIAVLPFTDLSPGHDNAYFSDGITEEVINSLAQVEGVRVARTSALAYRDGRADVRDVGRQLGVATVLEGSVRKSGGKLRITVQLANASDGFQLWSRSYDRQLDDVFAIQEDVSQSIVAMVRGGQKRRPARTAPVPEVPKMLEAGQP
jgi:TolB-like protein